MTANDDYILEILENVGLITREQAVSARTVANQEDLPVLTILDREKVLDRRDALKALAMQFGMDMITLQGMEIDREVLDMVSPDVAQRYKIMPVYRNGNVLTVAIGDPLDVDTLDGLRYEIGRAHV